MKIEKSTFFSRGKIELSQQKNITIEAWVKELQTIMGDSAEVYKTSLMGIDIVIKKSAFTGLGIRINQSGNKTEILFNQLAPSVIARLLFMGIIPIIILAFSSWPDFEKEFISKMESSGLFISS
ncbi:MAG: hypothetical protein KDK36_18665 [Leptospiraceae bacterium]|nr:hypothetical protein [Leptospiraceae bacterium]